MPSMARRLAMTILGAASLAAGSVRPFAAAGFAASPVRPDAAAPHLAPGVSPIAAIAESVEVTVVNIDVVVSDRAGRRITGLTRDDFALFVDGKRVAITNFSGPPPAGARTEALAAALVTPPEAGTAAAAAPAAPGAAAVDAGSAATAGRQRVSLVVCVDSVGLETFRRNRLLEQVRGFVRTSLRPDDQVMLVSFDPDFHVWHPFRSSVGALGPELDSLMRNVSPGGSGPIDPVDTKHFYTMLERLLRSLGGLDGRKALFYVGNGRSADGTVGALHRLTVAANENLVTLDAFEAAGLRVLGDADAARMAPGASPASEQLAGWGHQDSLFSMARETGGRAALNGNDFSQDFAEIAGDLAESYSLGFTPAQPGDGKIHQLRVELARPGARATYRASYRERTADERLEGELATALIQGVSSNPLGVALEISGAAPAGRGQVRIALKLSVPSDRLALVPGAGGRTGQVSIVVAGPEERLGGAPVQKLRVPLWFAEADLARVPAPPFVRELILLVEPGRRRFAVAIRDDVARVSSILSEEVEVAAGAGSAVVNRRGRAGSS